ncbi:hypothetical protein RHS01_00267 [Rhizoctonia solani]|uniref:CCHC-type domain-containing protein n=1 Tax=Rhizoctonia solani TaxID=456999 RepID=A0A8H7IMY8_9AGAM|nr:hypothetical protein RHS01_00267 [Rhizoctonia solani]
MADSNVGLGTPQPEAIPYGLGGPLLPPHEHGRSGRGLGHPHLDQLGSHRALIQTSSGAEDYFPHPEAPALCRIHTKFRTLQMELDWNDAALRGQFAQGLHWEVQRQIATRERQPRTLRELQDAALIIDNALREEQVAATRNREERNRCRAEGLCVKCGKPGHKVAECRTGWKATPKEDKGKTKETAKISKDSEYQLGKENQPLFTIPIKPDKAETLEVSIDSGATSSFMHPHTAESLRLPLIDLPTPRTVTMLDGSSPQAGKIWKKANLTFSFDGKQQAAIAEEEEADKTLLKEYLRVPSIRQGLLRDELKAGKICPSKSSISSPVMFVPKKDGSRRLVVDYRCLNNRTKKNVFTKLDLRWGYNNVRVKEGDKWKTAFRTKYGLYESLVMTFGLTNAPASFQHFMSKLFKDLLDVCVIIYLDDILIYSKDDATHTQHVHEVLRRLMENQLFCKSSKCTFHVTSVEYLGIIVLDKGFSLDKLKIQAVQEWPTPTKVKEVQSFLGFANFLRRFVANFSHMARPLHNLVRKDTPWQWSVKEQEAFQGLKDAITNAPVLRHADPTKPYFLETDASGAALGAILSQRQEDGRLHPLGFLSESFKGAKQNYNTHNKELLAIIRSFEYWRIF